MFGWLIKRRLLIQPEGSLTGWKPLKLCILRASILKVTINGLFRLTHTFTVMFGSPSTRVISSVTIAFLVLLIWPHKFSKRLLYNSLILVVYSELGLGPLQASGVGSFQKIFGSFTYYLWSQGFICYVVSGFRYSPLISIPIMIQLLLSSFSK